MLYIKDLKVNIDGANILANINLNIKKGEVHAIMGPNGSGKSTLAKVIAGHPAYEVVNGTITFDVSNQKKSILDMDVDVRAKEGIFTAFQNPVAISNLTNFKFFYSFFQSTCAYHGVEGMNESDFRKYMLDISKKIDMDKDFLDRDMNDGFSGGERKKNEILQMLVMKPKIAILDEIDSGLDIDSLKMVSNCINSYKSKNTSVILITHYQRILNYVKPDFVHIIYNGKIIKTGDIELSNRLETEGYEIVSEFKEH